MTEQQPAEYVARLETENARLRMIVQAVTSVQNRNVWNYEEAVQRGHIKPGALEVTMEELRGYFALIDGAGDGR